MREFILGYLLNAAWEAPLIAAGAFLLLRFVRLDARERCWMGIGFLMLAVMLPALDRRLAPSFSPPTLPEAVSYAVSPDLPAAAPPSAVMPVTDVARTPSASPTPTPAPGQVTLAPLVGLGLLWAFLAAVVVGSGRLAMGPGSLSSPPLCSPRCGAWRPRTAERRSGCGLQTTLPSRRWLAASRR